ncbi:unnamed protein product [Periconia digitata]|uniref:Uncharacterized protein n=1 Tax=Periconia digitata TaxID=1303443 RepID=A0A9W4UH82_9PLEO|nr:unnamed protein product [Periconia digitata]
MRAGSQSCSYTYTIKDDDKRLLVCDDCSSSVIVLSTLGNAHYTVQHMALNHGAI